jgi:SpoVK/Ycf46/Vps4 family AAA+-type ATPase
MLLVVLRKLEYQDGVIFMTTNRPDAIDHAILSRMHIRVKYPGLSPEARVAIWTSHLETLPNSLTKHELRQLSEEKLNGRSIANCIHVASLMAGLSVGDGMEGTESGNSGNRIVLRNVREAMALSRMDDLST